ncbi:MAG TPA: sigma-70 family RNA polymerase sigma factor [Thermoanaerobaculia bacterium]|nr:sigma-70 family RNA polymerase sigma factor [Thermoanaerobaculia bacterium]
MTSSIDALVASKADGYDVISPATRSHQSATDAVMEIPSEIEQLHAASFGWAMSCCGRNHDQAEEVLQDVYVKILEGKARFDGRSSLKTWLFAVIRRTAAAQARRRILHDFLTARWARRELEPLSDTADSAAEKSQISAALIAALQKVSRRQREVLELVFYHDMTIEQAAAAMHVSLGSARVHYDRGKKQLLAQLNGKLTP